MKLAFHPRKASTTTDCDKRKICPAGFDTSRSVIHSSTPTLTPKPSKHVRNAVQEHTLTKIQSLVLIFSSPYCCPCGFPLSIARFSSALLRSSDCGSEMLHDTGFVSSLAFLSSDASHWRWSARMRSVVVCAEPLWLETRIRRIMELLDLVSCTDAECCGSRSYLWARHAGQFGRGISKKQLNGLAWRCPSSLIARATRKSSIHSPI